MMSFIMVIATIVTAIATGVIAYYAWRSHEISEAIIKFTKRRDEEEKEFKQQIKDLYQGIIISNVIGTPHGANSREPIEAFKKLYTGNTKIFD
jgi:hypothetical protein